MTLDRRGIRPLPPGRVQGNGSYAPNIDALVTGNLALTWTHRDRLTQTSPVIVDHTGGSIGPEPGVSYIIEVRWVDPDSGMAILPAGVVIDAATAASWSNTCRICSHQHRCNNGFGQRGNCLPASAVGGLWRKRTNAFSCKYMKRPRPVRLWATPSPASPAQTAQMPQAPD